MKFKKLFNKGNRRKPRANAFVLETLEPRLLLSATPMTAAVVTTDHLDYAPGETAVITTANTTGDGLQFAAGELVRFQVSRTDGMADASGTTTDVGPAGNGAWYVMDGVGGFAAHQEFDASGQAIDRDGNGVADWIAPDIDNTINSSISTSWFVEEQYRNSSLVVTAAGQESGAIATQAFTDAGINTTTTGTNSAPSGADTTITINENTPYTFSVADFGFTDPHDSPANVFQSVTITALPIDGILTLNGTPVQAGDSIILPQAGVAWAAHESSQQWHTVASSADGTRLVAGAYGGQLYTSTDAGVTWTARESSRGWVSVASSADGTKLVAAALNWGTSGDWLYTSTDAGVTWTARESTRQWRAVASSADGMQLVAGAYGGQLYTSSDAGVTWTAHESNRGWISVASSADGMQLVAGALGGQLYTSTDAGVTWTAHESNRDWLSVTSSTDGTRLAAAVYGGQLYTSTDAGTTWTAHESNRIWYSLASSVDGTKLVAAADGGQLYTSTDAGVTWTAHENIQRWLAVASSADGSKLVAGAYGGQLYTSVPQPLGLVYTPAAGAHGTSLASVSFQVQDSGGTANGGVNRDQTANTITFNVTPVHQPVTTTVTNSVSTPTYGDVVTFTATLTPAAGTARPAGLVEFFDGATSLGSTDISNNGTGLDSIFTLSISTLTAGTHMIHAVYTATDALVHSTSGNITQMVSKANATVTGYSGVYDGAAHGATGTATGVFGESLSGLVLSAPTHIDAGIYLDTFTFTDMTGNYNNVASGSVISSIDTANAAIVVTGYTGVYTGAVNQATGTVTGIGGVDLSAGLDLSGTAHTNAGTYTDSWIFTDVTGNFTSISGSVISSIAKAEATITVEGYTGIYDAAAHGSTGMVVGVLGDLSAAGTSLDLGSSFTNAPGGTADWIFFGGTNYNDQSGSVAITIDAKAISYTIGNASHIFGSTIGMATVLGTTFLTGVNGENLGIAYSSTGNRVPSLVGSYAIHGSASDGTGMLSNYDLTINSGTLTVTTPSVITIVQDGVNLIIVGTDSRDTIRVNATNPNSITVNRETHCGDADDAITGDAGDDVIFCDMEKDTLSYSVGAGGHVIVYGMAGRDNIRLTGTVNLEAHGGDGNDTITGGAGHDVIWGDQGNDTLTGNAGNDVLVGGLGSDRLVGSAGHDLLISGELMGDHNGGAYDYAALRAIDDSWAANWSVDSDLESTSGDVLDESGSTDKLTGNSGHDWFILGSTDKITDIKSTTKDGDKITY